MLCDNHRFNIHPLKNTTADCTEESDVPSAPEKEKEEESDELEPSSALLGSCFSGLVRPITAGAVTKEDVQDIIRTAHPALVVLSDRKQSRKKKPGPDVAALEKSFNKRQKSQRPAIIHFDPLPLSRNIEPVKGHMMGRQRYAGPGINDKVSHVHPSTVAPGGMQSAPLSTVLAEQQTSGRPFRSQHVVRPRNSIASMSSGSGSWGRPVSLGKHRMASSSSSRDLNHGAPLHDTITSHHSSVLDGTDVEFSESTLTTPVKTRHHQCADVEECSAADDGYSPTTLTAAVKNPSQSGDCPSDREAQATAKTCRCISPAALEQHVLGPAVGQLITTIDDDQQKERMLMAAHPDILVCIDPVSSSGHQVQQPPPCCRATEMPITSETIAAVTSQLEESFQFDQVRTGNRPDILQSLGSSSDELNEGEDAAVEYQRGEWGSVDLLASPNSSSDTESTTGCTTPTDPYPHDQVTVPLHDDNETQTRAEKTTIKPMRPCQSKTASHSRISTVPGHAQMIGSSGSESDDPVIDQAQASPPCASSHCSSEHKKQLMASVWKDHFKNLRRIQSAAAGSHSACSFNSSSSNGSQPRAQTPSTSSPSSSPSTPSPVAGGFVAGGKAVSARRHSSSGWHVDREAVLPAALTGVL